MGGTWAAADGQDCTTDHTGSCSLKFTGTNAAKSLSFAVPKGVVAGDDFLFSIWRKTSSVPKTATAGVHVMAATTATLNATIQVYNSSTLVATYLLPMTGGTYAFTQSSLSFTVTVPSYTNLVVTLLYNGSAGTVWFDDASLVWAP
ncbi:MAG: hypothetical protein ABSA23_09400 [Anaerolineales bacterium]|jgi:hypothetical protein